MTLQRVLWLWKISPGASDPRIRSLLHARDDAIQRLAWVHRLVSLLLVHAVVPTDVHLAALAIDEVLQHLRLTVRELLRKCRKDLLQGRIGSLLGQLLSPVPRQPVVAATVVDLLDLARGVL